MPSRKQRRRREKSFRHEYETVLLDEEGNEVPLDPVEARAAREERDRQRTKEKAKAAAPAKRGGRLGREPQPPSWRRAFRRGGLMGAVIFVAFVFILKGGSQTSRAAIAIVYAVAFIPLTYWIDRFAYRSYQRRLAKHNERR
ncbi:MAG TPA: hypothetical protein VFA19_16170 [Gaiellaceae bacterium]|nr:hypothetical protein [Gaiellaceae bacterium]